MVNWIIAGSKHYFSLLVEHMRSLLIEEDMDVMKLHEYQGAEGIAIDFLKPKEVEAGVEAVPLR